MYNFQRLGLDSTRNASFKPCIIKVSEENQKQSVLNSVYKGKDGELPVNDVGVYMSDKTSPEVRDYMKRTVLQEQANQPTNETYLNTNGNDDAVLDGMPNRGETRNHYEQRVIDMAEREKQEIQERRSRARYKKALKEFNS